MSEDPNPTDIASSSNAETTALPNASPAVASSSNSAIPPAQSSSTLAAPLVGPDGTTITASAANTILAHPIPTKPRSNSQLRADRPAPPSPAPSRPGSQVLSPQLLASNFPSPSPGPRDRAGSTSSSRGGRRVSSSSGPSRTGSKPRPRSALGASSFLPSSTDSETTDASAPTESSLAQSTIPEDRAVATEASKPESKDIEVIIRDFAFPASDPRFAGPGLPLSAPSQTSSRRNSRWGPSESPDPASGSGPSGRKGSSWSGFGLLNWRSLMGRRKSNDASSQAVDDDDDDDESEDFRLPAPDHDEDDYAFSDSETPSEEGEPWGFYRAAFPFEAVGEHEIGLEEGTIVEVRGRGGGDGWVVAVKRRLDGQGRVIRLDEAGQGEGKEGLVPEGYLEKAGELEMAPPTIAADDQTAPPTIANTKTTSPTAMDELKRDPQDPAQKDKNNDTTDTKLDDDGEKGEAGKKADPEA